MRKERLGTKGWGLAISLAMGLMIGMAAHALGEENPNEAEEEPTITIRVLNYTKLSERELTEAGARAGKVLQQAGIKVLWLSCYSDKEGFQAHPACDRIAGPTDISLRILYRPKVLPPGFQHSIGFSLVPGPGEFGDLSSVYYDHSKDMAARARVALSVALGHAAAHEIGHLLLATNRHSRTGIMRAQWSDGEMHLAVLGHLCFTHQEVQILRAGVFDRMRAQAGAVSDQHTALQVAAYTGKGR